MPIKDRTKRIVLGGAAAVGLTLGVAALSGAATTPTPSPTAPAAEQDQDPSLDGSIQAPEDESASEADEAKALEGLATVSAADAEKAALAAVPGGTVNGTELGNENGSVVYEVDMTDANGKALEVKVDAGNAKVLDQSADDEGSEANEGSEGPEANEGNETDEGSEADEGAETGAPEATLTR